MIEIKDKAKCCGCTACYNVCPKQCIKMEADFEGFLYPKVDASLCINCNLCDKVCPVTNDVTKNPIDSTYVVRHKDAGILYDSTSGGAFTAIAEYVIEQNGIVWGAAYDEDCKVVHMCVENDCEKLGAFRGSKYVQSDLGVVFSQLKKQLETGRKVLFSGTPCQVAGLNSYLGKEYENLLTVEVICKGVPSPLLWEKYLNYQRERYASDPEKISFKRKTYGYHSSTMEIIFKNGKAYRASGKIDYMLKSYIREMASRPSCYECAFKGMERTADISIFDCWHASELVKNLKDDDKGYTNVFINTSKGSRIFSDIESKIDIFRIETEKAIGFDGIMVNEYPKKNKNRDDLYKKLNSENFESVMAAAVNNTKKDYLVERSKKILYKMGIIYTLKKIKD